MKFKIVFIALYLLGFNALSQDQYDRIFETANGHYKAGEYDSAKLAYTEILNNGVESFELFYNLGNTYFKNGNVPAAILYYERALKLKPTDKDVKHNLMVVNGFITDKIEPIEEVILTRWWRSSALSLGQDGWAWLFLLLVTITCGGIAGYFLARSRDWKQLGFFTAIISVVFSTISLSLGFESKRISETDFGVVFSPSVNVKSAPEMSATVQFVMHEGLKVQIIEEEDNWLRIRLTDGNTGWVSDQSIELI
ncbi:tetratricopeptide repeat protein [Salibacteraceae bacterium]|nr:tetratricopeptide repeat protein [Salibacteraceae bacterium]